MFRNINAADRGAVALWFLSIMAFGTAAYMASNLDHENAAAFVVLSCTIALALYIAGNQVMLLDRFGQSNPGGLQSVDSGPLPSWLSQTDREAIGRSIARQVIATMPPWPGQSSDDPPAPAASNVVPFPQLRRSHPHRHSA